MAPRCGGCIYHRLVYPHSSCYCDHHDSYSIDQGTESDRVKDMNKRYGLRGGLYGLVAVVILFLVTVSLPDPNWKNLLLLSFPIIAVFLIVVGLMIGWLYGRSKNTLK